MNAAAGEGYSRAKAEDWLEQVPVGVRSNMRQLHQAESAWQQVAESGSDYPEIREFAKIYGIGKVSAHGLSAYIMDPHRFASASKLYAYSKLAVRHHTSQDKRTRAEKLIPAGHGNLKAITHRAVVTALRHPKPYNEVWRFYQASLERSNTEKNARLNTQRKILKTCWSLWKHNDEYRPGLFPDPTGQ